LPIFVPIVWQTSNTGFISYSPSIMSVVITSHNFVLELANHINYLCSYRTQTKKNQKTGNFNAKYEKTWNGDKKATLSFNIKFNQQLTIKSRSSKISKQLNVTTSQSFCQQYKYINYKIQMQKIHVNCLS